MCVSCSPWKSPENNSSDLKPIISGSLQPFRGFHSHDSGDSGEDSGEDSGLTAREQAPRAAGNRYKELR
ncbi:hypothetical protein CesoFtcFv8_025080 [Champsocephalus esox]|uniref:Uncharacterized protein n=1 Tax=Champsocephalus esox TaxID=159716 RepID=A0AAN8B422_9TELE|nr:hypothetical protein CesoFtcFv8_025080 [Champsocephalus esox]